MKGEKRMYSELTKMEGKRIVIRTFGYFDIFVDGETIPFSCKKAKELLALRKTLNAYGIERVLHRVNQESRIRTEHVECDLYDYLEDEEKHKKLFKGVYMTNYSWAENTLGTLLNQKE